ncbi:MAG: phosphatase PAP2 family protein [Bacteroidetes bacterium GWD2_45_23]|nr:MAG: phosphatase PAP2 family protein [Bacteroidetes bacterium GWC2_46_850]OFX73860.1 MAG: phosphatase PAP2 family protein [Bacteroidetes bacterium GWC1_47_7]OFX86533.1 MAG: phosphatase PAP2 family protein [Bacteroidetes bacterium GWD2_45_23]HBB00107.1 phosphatase PAP2 family protein [Porphyromonadaceae bacterium]HCC17041.1 phosphatase PAP2 family protein [Porphyromonadaceae bacterium]
MIDFLNSIDTQLFLYLNSLHNAFFDPIMYWFSDKWIWIPMYALMAFFIIKHFKMNGVVIILTVGLVIVLCDQTASGLIKHLVMRLRPSHEPSLAGLIHLSKAGAGGTYGFVSSHAANSFGLATFLYFVLDNRFKILKYWLFTWAVLVSYSRIYNGVHYPGDVIVAAIIGCLIGWGMSKLFLYLENKRIKTK